MMSLTQKEKYLLEDQKSHEELCIKKYNNYAAQAQDPQLKQLFESHAKQEEQHLNTINQILSSQVPSTNQQQSNQSATYMQTQSSAKSGMVNQNDSDLCTDLLSTEKYVSGTYDTAIFEFRDSNIRQALNHIQKEEQQHGESIFNYMQSKGMYNPQ
ncbi:Spore coat protein CotF [Proteiniborus ethanoligenes]|uniref:Spore coat protein CotF n=1 Tax=Proteiniborus ethanoligenes TaxID=415015 RepID=A0A1H3QAR7_9FIRM|nr:demethoxyubiquinone hydroxylase family protein [Proteiniborus ethanoligenes]SDZ10457.1 Spore coat protein CotF [Proteiniborus ethanoligenes]